MQLFLFRLAGILVPLLVLSQFAVPDYLGGRVENRLTENGGSAKVDLGAFPSLRLLAGGGDKLFVRANDLRIDLASERKNIFDRLDRFDDVTIAVSTSRAGPFEVRSFFLDKLGKDRYRVFAGISTTASDLGRYAGQQLGGSFGGLLAQLTASALAGGGRTIPAQMRATIDTSGDSPRALDAQADVGGLPAGPLAIVVTDVLLAGL